MQTSNLRQKLSLRYVIQKRNFRHLGDMVELAKSVGADRISFLAADVYSAAFHRDMSGMPSQNRDVILNRDETSEFRTIVDEFLGRYSSEINHGLVSENEEKFYHIVEYFEALAGVGPFPRNHCDAPMISVVITSTGDLLPCYFLPPIGNIREVSFTHLLNNRRMTQTRKNVRANTLRRCQECVCTLRIRPWRLWPIGSDGFNENGEFLIIMPIL